MLEEGFALPPQHQADEAPGRPATLAPGAMAKPGNKLEVAYFYVASIERARPPPPRENREG